MRLNKFIALHTEYSRRKADELIASGRIRVNNQSIDAGYQVQSSDTVTLDNQTINTATELATIIFHKPAGYVCSRDGQGSDTIYSLLPKEYQQLNSVGRLDKDSSGLLILTNDGELAQKLTHPSHHKIKVYVVSLNKQLQPLHQQMISDFGVTLDDGPSKFEISKLENGRLQVSMYEGRNRQIRRTFEALGYRVKTLHRVQLGTYSIGTLQPGSYQKVDS
jgi:23S rRNA pseudouridine2605 synthase